MWDNLFSSVNLIEKGIDAAWLRNEVISNNIANIDTPGFKKSEVEFEDLMADAIQKRENSVKLTVTNPMHITMHAADASDIVPTVVKEDATSTGLDENNVDVENEMVALAKNSIEYYTLVSKVNSEFQKLDTAINIT
ncbi:MAG: flagellar basal body rod protein FlgB [Oscillospiraceae bacterium]